MQKYDLSNLTYLDFEELCKDILKYKENKEYRTFKQGKDGGIDILSLDENFIEIGQAKHYIKSGFKNLISNLKKEKEKIAKLKNLNRYILFTSLELGNNELDKIIETLNPYLKKKDIYDNQRIQDILNEKEAKTIIDKWEKLWMPTPYFLQMIYEKFKNREYDYKKEEIIQDSKKFVKPKLYDNVVGSLEQKGVVVIHGEPGTGKTTLARNIVAKYISQGYQFIYGQIDELNKINQELYTKEKVIVLIDDFLGSNVMSLDMKINDQILEEILKKCYKSTNKKVILTTRTYIYNNGVQKLEKFCNINQYIDQFLLTNNEYTYIEKAKIFYNHLYYNNIMEKEEYQYLLEDELYCRIIMHENFNPKTIALLCEHFEDIGKENTKKNIIQMIKNPNIIWEKEYDKLNKTEKMLLHIIIFMGEKIEEKHVEEQFWEIISNEKIQVEDDCFQKGIKFLQNSFIKRSISNEEVIILEISNHNIVDFILQKINQKEIKVQRYIDSAIYIDILKHMYDLLQTKTDIKDKILEKLENNYNQLKHTKVYWLNNVFMMLGENCEGRERRKQLVNSIIDHAFELEDFDLIQFLIEQTRSEYYQYILIKFYETISKSKNMLLNTKYINTMEELMRAIKNLEELGIDISFIDEQYDVFWENLIIAVVEEIEQMIKIEIVLDEEMSQIWDNIEEYVEEKIEQILEEHYLLFKIQVEEIYPDVLNEIKKRKKKINTKRFKQEAIEEWGDIKQTEEETNQLQNDRIEIVKMFENKIPIDKKAYKHTIKVHSYVKKKNEVICLDSDDEL